MGDGWGSIRTTDGELVVGDDALRIRRPPGEFLRGQVARLRRGGPLEGIAAAGRVVLFLALPVFVVVRITELTDSTGVALAVALLLVALQLLPLALRHSRATRIPLSAVEDVTLDPDERELTVTHDPREADPGDGRLYYLGTDLGWSLLTGEPVETELSPRTDADVREARETLRQSGVVEDIDRSDTAGSTSVLATETETEYRYESRDGVVFCPDCGTQVSPSDRTCPACGSELRIERPADDSGWGTDKRDAREPAVEF